MPSIPFTIGAYLMFSYLYYIHDVSAISDELYDQLCKHLHDNWETHKNHIHAHLVTKEDLAAGTAYRLTADNYPLIIKISAERYISGDTDWIWINS